MSSVNVLEDAVLSLFLDEETGDALGTIMDSLDASRDNHRQAVFHVQRRTERFLGKAPSVLCSEDTKGRVPMLHQLVGRCHLQVGDYVAAASWLTSSLDAMCSLCEMPYALGTDIRERVIGASATARRPTLWGGKEDAFPFDWWAASTLEMRGRAFASMGSNHERSIALDDYGAAVKLLRKMPEPSDQPHVLRLKMETLLNAGYVFLRAGFYWSNNDSTQTQLLDRSIQYYRGFLALYERVVNTARTDPVFRNALTGNWFTRGWSFDSLRRSWKADIVFGKSKAITGSMHDHITLEQALWDDFVEIVGCSSEHEVGYELAEFMADSLGCIQSDMLRKRLRSLFLSKQPKPQDLKWLISLVDDTLQKIPSLCADISVVAKDLAQDQGPLGEHVLRVLLEIELSRLTKKADTTENMLRQLLENVDAIVSRNPGEPTNEGIIKVLRDNQQLIRSVYPELGDILSKIIDTAMIDNTASDKR